MAQKKKSPLFFLPLPDRASLREKFQEPDNLEWLARLIYRHIRDRLFARRLHPREASLVSPIGGALISAILKTLKTDFPDDAEREASVLLRSHPERAGALLNRALNHLTEVCVEDFIRHPEGSLEDAVKRILPRLQTLPKYARPQSRLWDLFLLAQYRDEYRALREEIGVKDWKSDPDPDALALSLERRKAALKALYPWAPEETLRTWAPLPPWQIAWEVVALRSGPEPPKGAGIPAPERPRRSAAYLRRMQRRAQALADALDKALQSVRSRR